MAEKDLPEEVAGIRKAISKYLDQKDSAGRIIGNSRFGVYAFYDYDGEPIYVGKTDEKLRTRIRRHMTNQRTDAVAMSVLDPFEVADIEVWPIYPAKVNDKLLPAIRKELGLAEYTVFQKVLRESALHAVLNEKDIPKGTLIKLPPSFRARIIPDAVYNLRKHPDIRIARRASTIASLARVISERNVSKGLRQTLLTQARRLERLARIRFDQIAGEVEVEGADEETGDND